MSTPPLDQQQQEQQLSPLVVVQQAYTAHKGHGSVGPVIAVVAVITILGFIAGMIGRLCTGRRILGYGEYDFEGWVERKCSSCLDGRLDPPSSHSIDIPTAAPVMEQRPQQIKEEEQQPEQEEEEEEEKKLGDKSKIGASSSQS